MTGERLPHDWFPASLPGNVRLGQGTWLYSSFAFQHWRSRGSPGLNVGEHCGLYNGTFFDLGPSGQVEIGDYSAIVGAIICSNGRVRIGSYVFIAHEVVMADRATAMPYTDDEGKQAVHAGAPDIEVGDKVWIGARAVLLGGARIGEGTVVGAGAVVDSEVPPRSVVAGNPARVVASLRGKGQAVC